MQNKQLNKIFKYSTTLKPTNEWLVKDSNEGLRGPHQEVKLPLQKTEEEYLAKMISYIDCSYNDTLDETTLKPGIGIAAPQVGWNAKATYINVGVENNVHVQLLLLNPKLTNIGEEIAYLPGGEGCLSVDEDHPGTVPRFHKVQVSAWELLTNKQVSFIAEGLLAIILQHEVDHLNGKLYYDHINVMQPDYIDSRWILIGRNKDKLEY